MSRHAYLIMAHNQFDFLEMLLRDLDFEDNDVYLHVDKKANSFDEKYFKSILEKSELTIIPRKSINWAGYSIVDCILTLLEYAVEKGGYEYYHLLTGSEFPILSQQEIHAFFDKHRGYEFVGFDANSSNYLNRVKYFHIFNERGRNNTRIRAYKGTLAEKFINIQKILETDRSQMVRKIWPEFKKGNMTWSITAALAEYIVSQRNSIRKFYAHTWCCDEIFVQTIVYNSDFYNSVFDKNDEYKSQMRMCQWDRPDNLYHLDDVDMLVESGRLFARKLCGEEGMEIAKLLKHSRKDSDYEK